ncbi:CAP domain-containing protein [Tenacibaculum aiptasiae]|uniref:CAP domain-containing protein n=1 Tax=Tenacibaculum aiptasiae TaxID=426481 RepID=A0A7J5AP74_9FLAO|nr:CAP domain-containing protein [Tenacibaculum aiptasiae]KAB1159405.1 CAP domain-containing protein [Tenacibaculum aiptasiae]
MKNKILLLIAISVNIYSIYSQQLTTSQEKYLNDLLTKKINLQRKKMGIHLLEKDINLAKAAKLHADYMSKSNNVTHSQKSEELKTPYKRVLKYSESFTSVGENVLKTRSIKPPFSNKKLGLIANLMFKAWKKSPDHYSTMIGSEFSYADFGFSYNIKKRQFFVAHVFGNKIYKVPNQLSKDAFGIRNNTDCKSLHRFNNIIASLGNNISIEENEIILRFHNKEIFNTIFNDSWDGIAVDLVTKDQIKCGAKNKLDSSPIYDGVLLPPFYRDELISKNKAKGDYRVVISLGKIPDFLKNKIIAPNIIIIKGRNKCAYKIPVTIPSSEYNLIPIKPKIFTPNIKLKTEGISFVKELYFDFYSSKVTAHKITPIKVNKDKTNLIDIKSFTSIDGTFKNNQYLFNKRAVFIKEYLKNNLKLNQIKIVTEAKENWELFDFQLEIYGLDKKLNSSKKEKRKLANTKLRNKWKQQFENQRKSKAIIFEKGTWAATDKNHAYYNLINALLNNDINIANKALATLYNQKNDLNYILDQDFILERLLHQKDLVQNTSALIIKNINFYQIDTIIYYINYWLKNYDKLNSGAQKNLLNLYSITAKQLLMFWDTDKKRLARVLHPEKVDKLFSHYKNSEEINPLYLNYQMAIINYYGQINNYQKINDSFVFITDYYSKKSSSIEDDVNLALFFNRWSMYHLTINLLSKGYIDGKLNEDASFILAQTLIAYPDKQEKILLKMIQQKAIKYNKNRWCNWINRNYQNLRFDYIKDLYCSTCNKN